MAKFKCLDCGNIFNGDNATMTCAKCNSQNITTQSSSPILTIIATIVAAIIVIIIAINSCGSEPTVSLSSDGYNNVTIAVTGISAKKLKMDYQITIHHAADSLTSLAFDGSNKSVIYKASRMLEGDCYDFRIVRKNNKINNIRWIGGTNSFCMPTTPIVFTPTISSIEEIPSQKTLKYTVIIKVDSIPDGVNLQYSIGNNTQNSNRFSNIPSGSHTITVRCGNNSTSINYELYEITPVVNLTKKEIQNILDKVATKELSVPDAERKLTTGNDVILKYPIKNKKTLYDILINSHGYGRKYKVIDFKNDPNTGKIASGSLELIIK